MLQCNKHCHAILDRVITTRGWNHIWYLVTYIPMLVYKVRLVILRIIHPAVMVRLSPHICVTRPQCVKIEKQKNKGDTWFLLVPNIWAAWLRWCYIFHSSTRIVERRLFSVHHVDQYLVNSNTGDMLHKPCQLVPEMVMQIINSEKLNH